MSAAQPKISVIMPCYNEEENIANAIGCILRQTFAEFELIIVDNCSEDNTEAEVRKFSDPRIVYVRNEKNMGAIWSRNHALSIARGKYIACLDGDDTCDETRIEKQFIYMETHPKCVFCGTLADVYDGKTTRVQGKALSNKGLKIYLTKNNPFVHSSAMFRRVINGEVVQYPNITPFDDYALWIHLSKYGEFHNLPEILVHRNDVNNFDKKDTWRGYNKNKIYRRLIQYQFMAIKATGYWIPGILYFVPTALKICASSLTNK